MLEALGEILIEFFGEIVLQLLLEGSCEAASHAVRRFRGQAVNENRTLASIGYALFGALAGVASLVIAPHHLIRAPRLRGASLVVTPIIAGLAMSGLGRLRVRRGQPVLPLDTFFYGSLFAFTMALVRYLATS